MYMLYVIVSRSVFLRTEIIVDVSVAREEVEGGSQTPQPPPNAVSPPSLEREPYKKLGLTKQVLVAHTQKEEQTFLCRFREQRGVQAFQANCSQYLERQKGQGAADGTVANMFYRHYNTSSVLS